jgi:predicted extracellular nuclease
MGIFRAGIFVFLLLVQSALAGFIPCERILVDPNPSASAIVRPIESIRELRVATYNVENLFLHVGHYEGSKRVTDQQVKPTEKVKGVAKAILDMNPDILVLQEVEDIDALSFINKSFLQGRYTPILIKGNDPRGIDVGFLVKKDLPFKIEALSYKNQTWHDPRLEHAGQTHLFSRDLPVLLVKPKNAMPNAPPLFVLAGTHFKSKRPPNSPEAREADPESNVMRGAQAARAAQILSEYRSLFGDNVPVMLAGDFNGAVNFEPEFDPLKKDAQLTDAFDLLAKKLTDDQRITHIFYAKKGKRGPRSSQLDAVLVSPALRDAVLSAEVYRYIDPETGKQFKYRNPKTGELTDDLPLTKRQRDRNPSDHWPVLVRLDFTKFLKRP